MPSWLPSFKKRSNHSKKCVRFADFVKVQVSLNSNSNSASAGTAASLTRSTTCVSSEKMKGSEIILSSKGSASSMAISSCAMDSRDSADVVMLDSYEERCLERLDRIGHLLDNTFKEVALIDSYVYRMQEELRQDRISTLKYETGLCSARMLRSVWCKRQIEIWRSIQTGILDLHEHHLHTSFPPLKLESTPECNCTQTEDRKIDTGCQILPSDDVSVLLQMLSRIENFDVMWQRLTPQGDPRSFLEKYVLAGHDRKVKVQTTHNFKLTAQSFRQFTLVH